MSTIFEPYEPNKNKSHIEQLDDILNRVMTQLDYLCKSAEFQNETLKLIVEVLNEKEN